MASLWGRVCGALVAGLCLAGTATAADVADPRLVPDPKLRYGALPNGLRYVLAPNATPKGGLSMRLVVDVGSVDETEAERGVAHFVEHMAFRSTRRFPGGQLKRAFADMGVAAGDDQNAFTTPYATVYRLDLPDGSAGPRGLALSWLRDVADGVLFERAEVEIERGVVLAERDARADPDEALRGALTTFMAPELRSTQRAPIGDVAVLKTAPAAALERFHARWYRPEHAHLIVVGDPRLVAGLESEIATAFGDWSGAGPAPVRTALPPLDLKRGLDALTVAEPRVESGLLVCRMAPPQRLSTASDLRQYALQLVASTALQARLDQLLFTDPVVLDAEIEFEGGPGEFRKFCASVSSAGADWRAALATVQMELLRFAETGPSDAEVEDALVKVRGGMLGAITESAATHSADVANELALAESVGDVTQDPRQFMRAANQALEGWTQPQVLAAWRDVWSGAGPFVSVVGPAPPPRQEVMAAWALNEKAPRTAFVRRERPVWAYASAAAPAKVVERRAADDFVRMKFANGVILNFKQTDFTPGTVEVRVDLGAGRHDLGGRPVSEGQMATGSLVVGGLGRHSYSELRAIFGEEPLKFDFEMDDQVFSFSAHTFRDRLDAQLLLISAYLTDPGFRDDLDAKLPAEVARIEQTRGTTPDGVIFQRLYEIAGVPSGSPAALAKLGSKDFAAWLRPILTTSPVEVTLIGDIDEAAAADLVGRTFGGLSPRRAAPPPPGVFGRFPPTNGEKIGLTHRGPPDKAMVAMVWPLFVVEPSRRREQRALRLLSELFDDELHLAVRERLGKSYAPVVELMAFDRADQAYLVASVETAPADMAAVEAQMRDLVARLAAGQIDPERLEAARKPLLAQVAVRRADNEWWALYVQRAARQPQDLRDFVGGSRVYAELSLQEIRAAAATWLNQPPLVFIATPESRK